MAISVRGQLRRLAAAGLKMWTLLILLGQAGAALAQDPPVTFTPIADAYVLDGAWGNSNFGTDVWLYTRTSNNQNYDSYLKFDTTGVASVASAKLRINASVSANANIGLMVHSVAATDWSETAITWNNKPARGGVLGSATVTGTAFVYYEIDVTSYLIAEKAAGRNVVSFALHNAQSSNQYVWMRSREAASNRPQLVITPNVTVVSLLPTLSTVTLGASTTLALTISSAQATDTLVPIAASPAGIVSVPAQVTIPAGQTSAPVPVGTLAYGQAGITASLNGSSASAGVNVVPPPVAVTALEPATFTMTVGASSSFTVRINAAQAADTQIALAASNPSVLQVPASVIVPAGATSAIFTATGLAVGDSTLTASANGTSRISSVHVSPQPAAIVSLLPTPLPLQQGATGSLAVTINVAQEVATTIALANSAPEVATVPESVVIAAGTISAQIPVTAASPGSSVITASVNGTSAAATVEVTPPPPVVSALTPETLSLPKGTPGTLRVTVSRAPNVPTPVALVSSDPAIASVPPQVNIPAGALFAEFPVMPNSPGQASITASLNGGSASSTVTVGTAELVNLTVAPQAPARYVGETVAFTATGMMTDGTSEDFTSRVTWTSSAPAVATINAGGVATALAAGQTTIRASFTFTAAQTGQSVTIEQSTQLSIQVQFAITGVTPATGPVGTAVAISGVGFDANLSGNQVKFNGEAAVIASGSATLLNVIVPPRATTGPITVTNFRGTTASTAPFTVQEREAFDITLAPASIQVPPGGQGGTRIRLTSTGLNPYPYAADLAITGLPAGITATLDRQTVALNQDAIVTFNAAAGSSGAFTITLTATGASGVTTQTVTKTLGVQVLAAGGTTVTGRVLHADDGAPFVGARIRLGGTQAFTDESGTYRFVNPPVLGDQVLLIDGNTNNTAQFEYPSGIAMPAMIVGGQDNKVLTSYIGRVDATRFTTVVPGQAATVTDPDLPNFSLNIQAGQTIIGWDGQPVTKINVRKVPVDRLPIRPIPEGVETRSVYLFYFFREGGGEPTSPIPVTLPNDIDAVPGETVTLYYYDEQATPDPNSNQWKVLGTGTVTQDGKSIVTDPGYGIPRFCCGAVFPGLTGGGNTGGNGGNGCGPTSPYPVDLASGNALVFRPRPFGISQFMSLDINCSYRSTDPRFASLFGRGFSFTYGWFAEQVGGQAVRVTNPQGVQFMLSLEADGIYRSRAGRSGSIEMEVTPTATGRTLKMADGTRYEFNTAGRLQAISDVAGNRTTFEVDALGFPFSITDPAGKVYEFTLSGSGAATRMTRITDPAGRYIEFTYNASRQLIAYRDQGGGITQFGYDAAGRINQVTDPRNAVKTIEYDSAGRAIREVLPENAEERYTYTAVGTTVAETRYTNANGHVTTYRWNGLGFETAVIDALGGVTKTELDPVTNLVKRRIDPAGRVTQFFYNSRGDMIRMIDADNKETKIDYDPRFRKPTRIENALGHVITVVYDAQGNLTSVTNAELETTTFTYNSRGQVETITDPLLRVTRFTYDVQGNLANTTNPANETATRIYDSANRMVELADSLNRTTRFTYDALDRVIEVRDALLGLTKYAYDASDNLLSVTDPNNNPVERNIYDLRNRLKQRTDAKNRNTLYDYDGVGNLIRMTDRKLQVTEYSYDALNRLTRMQDHNGRVTTYAYDLAGNLAQVSDTQSGDILMSYDALNRLIEVVTPQGTVAYTYDAIGRRLTRTLSGGDVTTYTYDKANRIKTVTLRGRTAAYTYDAAGRLTERLLPNGIKVAYQYDDADRVTSIAYKKTDDTSIETVSYTYDDAGQRISRGDGQVPPKDSTFSATYDEANRLTAITLNGEIFTLTYDDNGNLVSKAGPTSGTTTYSWNARDRLAALSGPSGSAAFKYDAFGRRIEKTVNGQSIGFLYDGAQAVAELKGTAIETIYHTGVLIDEVLARYATSGSKTLVTDALMSVIAQANDDQSTANFYAYSPYGEAITLGPDDGNALQYSGRENDGSGLYYYRARYYDPVLKRFIREDPIGMEAGPNLYAYVGGNPISNVDPTGELFFVPVVMAAALSGGGTGTAAMAVGGTAVVAGIVYTQSQSSGSGSGGGNGSNDPFSGGGKVKPLPPPSNPSTAGPSPTGAPVPLPPNVFEICPLKEQVGRICVFRCASDGYQFTSFVPCKGDKCPGAMPRRR